MTIKSGRSSCEGFSLIELMVTLAVAAILLALAVPSFIGLLRDSQRSSAVNDLLADLTFARSESIRRGRQMIVCASNDGATCGSSANWGTGWIVFEDSNTRNETKDNSESVLRSAAGRTASLTITANCNYLAFRNFAQPPRCDPDASSVVTFCDPRDAGAGPDKHSAQIVVEATGRPRLIKVGSVAAGTCP